MQIAINFVKVPANLDNRDIKLNVVDYLADQVGYHPRLLLVQLSRLGDVVLVLLQGIVRLVNEGVDLHLFIQLLKCLGLMSTNTSEISIFRGEVLIAKIGMPMKIFPTFPCCGMKGAGMESKMVGFICKFSSFTLLIHMLILSCSASKVSMKVPRVRLSTLDINLSNIFYLSYSLFKLLFF